MKFMLKVLDDGYGWVEECLSNGDAFSKLVKTKINLKEGRVFLAAETLEQDGAGSSDRSLAQGVSKKATVIPRAEAAAVLKELGTMQFHLGQLAILVEDNLSTPGAAVPADQLTGRMLCFRGYNIINAPLSALTTPTELMRHFSQSSGYPLNAFVVYDSSVASDVAELSEENAERVSTGILGIINAAYDGEAYTLWASPAVLKA